MCFEGWFRIQLHSVAPAPASPPPLLTGRMIPQHRPSCQAPPILPQCIPIPAFRASSGELCCFGGGHDFPAIGEMGGGHGPNSPFAGFPGGRCPESFLSKEILGAPLGVQLGLLGSPLPSSFPRGPWSRLRRGRRSLPRARPTDQRSAHTGGGVVFKFDANKMTL